MKKELPAYRDEILASGMQLATRIAHYHEQVLLATPKLLEVLFRAKQRFFDHTSRLLLKDLRKYEADVSDFSRQLSAQHTATGDDSLLLGLNPLSHQQQAIQHSFRDLREQIARRDQEVNVNSSLVVAGLSFAVGLLALFMTLQQIHMARDADSEMRRITEKFDQRMGTQIEAMNSLNERLKEQNSLTGKLQAAVGRQLEIIEKQDRYNRVLLARFPKPRIFIDPKLAQTQIENVKGVTFDIEIGIENSGNKALKGHIYYHIFVPEYLKIHRLDHELSSSLKKDNVIIDGARYVELSGRTGGTVHPNASLLLGHAILSGEKAKNSMLWFLSTEEGRFPVDPKQNELSWELSSR